MHKGFRFRSHISPVQLVFVGEVSTDDRDSVDMRQLLSKIA